MDQLFHRLLLLVMILSIATADGAKIGINYGRLGDNLPTPDQVVTLLKSNNITKARIFDSNSAVIQAFANSSIDISVSIPNEQLQTISASPQAAKSWLDTNLASFISNSTSTVRIPAISIGNEVLTNNAQYAPYLLPAMQNIYSAVQSYDALRNVTKVSTPHAFNVLDGSSFPPSNGQFNTSLGMQSIADFLSSTGSPFMINVYPFFSYTGDPTNVPLEYAVFGSSAAGVTDGNSNLHYSNLYDAMIDTVVSALSKLGHPNMSVVVTETGWPSKGDEAGATTANASKYNNNLIQHVEAASGTPLRPGVTPETYIFALFNENQKTGPTSERNFGLFQPNQAQVYSVKL